MLCHFLSPTQTKRKRPTSIFEGECATMHIQELLETRSLRLVRAIASFRFLILASIGPFVTTEETGLSRFGFPAVFGPEQAIFRTR